MKITRATIAGFQGIRDAQIELGRVNVFVGANGSGKTSMLEALLLPIFGKSRAPKKKDWSKMIREGMRHAEITVHVVDSGSGQDLYHTLLFKIMRSKVQGTALKKDINLFDRVLMDPLAFFELPPKVKADLVGDVPLNQVDIERALQDRGLEGLVLSATTSIIMLNRLAGAETVLRDRRLAASRAVQDPGAEPLFEWQGQAMVTPTEEQYTTEYVPTLAQWRSALATIDTDIRNARGVAAQIATRDKSIHEAMQVINSINVSDTFLRQAEMDQTLARVQDMKTRYQGLSNQLVALNQEPCPTCGQQWSPDAVLINCELHDLSVSIAADEAPLQSLQKEHAQWLSRCHEVRLAKEKLGANQTMQLPAVDMEDLDRRQREAQVNLTNYEAWCNAVSNHFSKVQFWRTRKDTANKAKDTRAQWDMAVKILEDPSFKSELVVDPLERIRSRLARTGHILSHKVEISDGLAITADDRDWWLLSDAQKLEVSVMLADAFAHAGGSKILKIDGVDTLVGSYQIKLLQFIRHVQGDYDTILLALASEGSPEMYQQLFRERQQATTGYAPLARWFWVEENSCRFKEEL